VGYCVVFGYSSEAGGCSLGGDRYPVVISKGRSVRIDVGSDCLFM